MINIAIDGPSGAGKSSCARLLAKKLGYIYVDTGAMYRAIGLYAFWQGISLDEISKVVALLPEIKIDIRFADGEQRVLLGERDVSSEIRQNEISMYASRASAIPEVRAFLLETQRKLARENNVIMDGRDIGTVILPNADLKIFLTASDESRARRRFDELCAKGQKVVYEEILAQIIERDKNDRERDIAPAIPAQDAIILDNSNLDLNGTADEIERLLNIRLNSKKKDEPSKFYRAICNIFGGIVRLIWGVSSKGTDNIPEDGAYLMCINHTSFADVLLLAATSKRQVHFLAKAELFKIPVLSSLIRALGAYPVRRGAGDVAAIKATLSLLCDGKIVGIFPQGTRSPGVDPANTEFKNGAAMIAARAKAGIIPVFINSKNYRTRPFSKNEVIYGEPIGYRELEGLGKGTAQYAAITEAVRSAICSLDPKKQDTEK